jgi:hypothetical protein
MKIKSFFAKPFAAYVHRTIQKEMRSALADQDRIFRGLLAVGQKTVYGKANHISEVNDYQSFKQSMPIQDYESLRPWIEKIKQGTQHVLWKGQPLYFAKTSGTTSGVKYIPITKDSIPNHINTARNALLCYMAESGNTRFADGKLIFLSGSPQLERVGGIPTGRLSGIVNHHVPSYLRANQLPSFETNCVEDWETKLGRIVEETVQERMTLISGIPPWMQMYFDALTQRTGKKVGELFPDFSVMVQGGVNFEPYKAKLLESIGRAVDTIELFPASEGFFAFQDTLDQQGLLLNTNSGIFFEFIPLAEVGKSEARRLSLAEVQLGENYSLVINSNAGLWGYEIGDVVRFVSLNPYRIVVVGRTKHYISAFGEHVIGEEVEWSMNKALEEFSVRVREFTVAPYVSQDQHKSCHEWLVEFDETPANLAAFAACVDQHLRKKNVYYDDLIKGNILQPLRIIPIQKGGFIDYMRSIGKLGGQNKVPRLSNDRTIANALTSFTANPLSHS